MNGGTDMRYRHLLTAGLGLLLLSAPLARPAAP